MPRISDSQYNFENAWFKFFDQARKMAGVGLLDYHCPGCNTKLNIQSQLRRVDYECGSCEYAYSTWQEYDPAGWVDTSNRPGGSRAEYANGNWVQRGSKGPEPVKVNGLKVFRAHYPLSGMRQNDRVGIDKWLNETRPPALTAQMTYDDLVQIARDASPIGKTRTDLVA